jgi:hypothetical protein
LQTTPPDFQNSRHRTYNMFGRRGEGGKDSTLDVEKAIADYAG